MRTRTINLNFITINKNRKDKVANEPINNVEKRMKETKRKKKGRKA
jgi:hypothetical protein